MESFKTEEQALTTEDVSPFFKKFYLQYGNVLHRFERVGDLYFHSHPFNMWIDVLDVGYIEEELIRLSDGRYMIETFERRPGTTHRNERGTIHRIVRSLGDGPIWTLAHYDGEVLPWHLYRLDSDGVLWQADPKSPDDWRRYE